tara:strand:- start:1334 stop:1591 length:258 start_codon:yes stop_codon:yes gene_type:complete
VPILKADAEFENKESNEDNVLLTRDNVLPSGVDCKKLLVAPVSADEKLDIVFEKLEKFCVALLIAFDILLNALKIAIYDLLLVFS